MGPHANEEVHAVHHGTEVRVERHDLVGHREEVAVLVHEGSSGRWMSATGNPPTDSGSPKVSLQHAGVVFLTDSTHANVERPAVLLVDPDDFLLSLIGGNEDGFSSSGEVNCLANNSTPNPSG